LTIQSSGSLILFFDSLRFEQKGRLDQFDFQLVNKAT
jgi:hypothetical protein